MKGSCKIGKKVLKMYVDLKSISAFITIEYHCVLMATQNLTKLIPHFLIKLMVCVRQSVFKPKLELMLSVLDLGGLAQVWPKVSS